MPGAIAHANAQTDGRATYLDVDGAAAYLTTSPRFVRRLVEERRIPFHKVGRHVRIAEADLAAFLAAGRIEATR